MKTGDLKKIASAREVILALIVVIFVFVAFFRAIYNPKSEQLSDIKKQMDEMALQEKSLMQQIDVLKLKQEKQQQTKELSNNIKVKILKRELPPRIADSVSMIEKIVSIGKTEGLVFDSMSSKNQDSKTSISRLNINFKVHGPFKSLTNFLEKLDSIQELFVIDSLVINSDPTKNVEASLDARATLFQVEGIHAKDTEK